MFDAITGLVAAIESQKRNIIIDLLRNYEIITDYYSMACDMSEKLIDTIVVGDTYFMIPVALPEEGKIKSGHNFCYDLSSVFPKEAKNNVVFVDSLQSSKIKISSNSHIIFIDDFIGTGRQVSKVIDKLIKNSGMPKSISVVAIRIQQEALDRLKSKGVGVIAGAIRKKAISSGEFISGMSVTEAMAAYVSIENMLKPPEKYRLGYGGSEAIITMKRTPNNTLPIFWMEKTDGGANWPAPFPRT